MSSSKPYEKPLSSQEQSSSQTLEVHDEKTHHEPLPSPVTAQVARPAHKPRLSAAAIIPIWIILSSEVIIYNNYVYNTLQFRFPVFLVTWHLTFAVSVLFVWREREGAWVRGWKCFAGWWGWHWPALAKPEHPGVELCVPQSSDRACRFALGTYRRVVQHRWLHSTEGVS